MMVDPAELREYVTVYKATGQARDELNMLQAEQKPTFDSFAKIEDKTATDGAVAGAKPNTETYRVLMEVHPVHKIKSNDAIKWGKKCLQVKTVQVLGDYLEWQRITCVKVDGI